VPKLAWGTRVSGHAVRPLVGYARVSTVDQRPELQEDALEQAGCTRIFTDKASGTRENRPALAECLDYVRPGDTLVVWRLDRLGRNMRHLVEVVNGLRDRGVEFRSLTEGFDTSTIGGQLVFHIFAALAEFERALIMERSAAGVAAARARGRVGGRPAKLTAAQRRSVRQLVAAKEQTVGSIAEQFGVSRGTIYRALGAEPPS
jgi:DNA invertase Pin-like site-specific DNA recombinase